MIKRHNILNRLRPNVARVNGRSGESSIRRRHLPKQALMTVLTLGIYAVYWFYVTSKEMVEHGELNGRPGLWTILLVVPIVNFYSFWNHGKALGVVTDRKYRFSSILALWIIFPPAGLWITQRELNRLAEEVEIHGETSVVTEKVEAVEVQAVGVAS